MYVSTFNPAAGFSAAQSGQLGTAFAPTSLVSSPYSSLYPSMGFMWPASSVMAAPGITSGAFSFPSQAVSYSFVPAMSAGMTIPAAGAGFPVLQTGAGLLQPRVELAETNSDIVITAELPNINPNDLNLTVTDDSVSISCTAFANGIASSVHRTVVLPTSIRSEQVTANYSNGILECHLPKSDVMARRRIRVNPSS